MGQEPQSGWNEGEQEIGKLEAGSINSGKRVSTKRFHKLSGLQFAAIAIAVATGFTSVGLAVIGLVSQRDAETSVKPSVIVPKSLDKPSAPLVFAPSPEAASPPGSYPAARPKNLELVYNVTTPPDLKQSKKLQAIVDDVVSLADAKKLSTKPLSITLIDVKSGEIAGHKQDILRYPASVVKMFWMVELYAQLEKGVLTNESAFAVDIAKMMIESDNNAASHILDQITGTQSGQKLNGEEYQTWLNKRLLVNRFFEDAGYKGINISQKTFPIPNLQLQEPKGNDLKMRGEPKKPIRNKVTTNHAARLLYEILNGQAVSPQASKKMSGWLRRDLNPEVWKKLPPNPIDFNPVESFFGESLPPNVQFYSKAGWTLGSRQEAAFVATQDGKTVYILVVFADDTAYGSDKKIFPEISRLVYDRMTEHSSNR